MKTQDIAEQYVNPFADSTNRFDVDSLLRTYGFKIYQRIRNQEPIWQRDGQIYLQSVAEKELPLDNLRLAKARQSSYYHQFCH